MDEGMAKATNAAKAAVARKAASAKANIGKKARKRPGVLEREAKLKKGQAAKNANKAKSRSKRSGKHGSGNDKETATASGSAAAAAQQQQQQQHQRPEEGRGNRPFNRGTDESPAFYFDRNGAPEPPPPPSSSSFFPAGAATTTTPPPAPYWWRDHYGYDGGRHRHTAAFAGPQGPYSTGRTADDHQEYRWRQFSTGPQRGGGGGGPYSAPSTSWRPPRGYPWGGGGGRGGTFAPSYYPYRQPPPETEERSLEELERLKREREALREAAMEAGKRVMVKSKVEELKRKLQAKKGPNHQTTDANSAGADEHHGAPRGPAEDPSGRPAAGGAAARVPVHARLGGWSPEVAALANLNLIPTYRQPPSKKRRSSHDRGTWASRTPDLNTPAAASRQPYRPSTTTAAATSRPVTGARSAGARSAGAGAAGARSAGAGAAGAGARSAAAAAASVAAEEHRRSAMETSPAPSSRPSSVSTPQATNLGMEYPAFKDLRTLICKKDVGWLKNLIDGRTNSATKKALMSKLLYEYRTSVTQRLNELRFGGSERQPAAVSSSDRGADTAAVPVATTSNGGQGDEVGHQRTPGAAAERPPEQNGGLPSNEAAFELENIDAALGEVDLDNLPDVLVLGIEDMIKRERPELCDEAKEEDEEVVEVPVPPKPPAPLVSLCDSEDEEHDEENDEENAAISSAIEEALSDPGQVPADLGMVPVDQCRVPDDPSELAKLAEKEDMLFGELRKVDALRDEIVRKLDEIRQRRNELMFDSNGRLLG